MNGPEAGSVLALTLLMDWLDQAHGARLLGFLSTMFKARRREVRQWLSELQKLADQRGVPVFSPIGDLASLASYAPLFQPRLSLPWLSWSDVRT